MFKCCGMICSRSQIRGSILIKALAIGIILASSSVAYSANCPNLSGRYWDVPGEKPNEYRGGTLTEIRQTRCDQLQIFRHWVNKEGKIYRKDSLGYTWKLGPYSGPCGYKLRIDCRQHPYSKDQIVTVGAGNTIRFPFTNNSPLCQYSEYSWSQDAQGNLVETTPVQCEDGYTGILERKMERVH
jgi:hypothetical protein